MAYLDGMGLSWGCNQIGSQGLTMAGRSTSEMAPSHGWQLTGGLSSSPCGPTTGLLEVPYNVAAGFLRACNPRWQNENHHVFHNLAFKVTLLNFHNILVITQDSPIRSGREQHSSVRTRKRGSLGAILETGFHSSVEQDWQQTRVDSLGRKNRGRQIVIRRNNFR